MPAGEVPRVRAGRVDVSWLQTRLEPIDGRPCLLHLLTGWLALSVWR